MTTSCSDAYRRLKLRCQPFSGRSKLRFDVTTGHGGVPIEVRPATPGAVALASDAAQATRVHAAATLINGDALGAGMTSLSLARDQTELGAARLRGHILTGQWFRGIADDNRGQVIDRAKLIHQRFNSMPIFGEALISEGRQMILGPAAAQTILGHATANLGDVSHTIAHEGAHVRRLSPEVFVTPGMLDLEEARADSWTKLSGAKSRVERALGGRGDMAVSYGTDNMYASRRERLRELFSVAGLDLHAEADRAASVAMLDQSAPDLADSLAARIVKQHGLPTSSISEIAGAVPHWLDVPSGGMGVNVVAAIKRLM